MEKSKDRKCARRTRVVGRKGKVREKEEKTQETGTSRRAQMPRKSSDYLASRYPILRRGP
jgi:hypothetical protein